MRHLPQLCRADAVGHRGVPEGRPARRPAQRSRRLSAGARVHPMPSQCKKPVTSATAHTRTNPAATNMLSRPMRALPDPRPPTPTRPPSAFRSDPEATGPGGFGRVRPPSSYSHDEGPGSSSRALRSQAVAVGFEPTVTGYATLAFEASSFGRSDTLPRESLDHPGPWTEIGSRGRSPTWPGVQVSPGQRVRKNAVSCSAHSRSRTPAMTSGRWFRRRSRITSQREPAAPAFSSRAP